MKNNQLFNGSLIFFLFIMGALFFSKMVNRQKAYRVNEKDLIQDIKNNKLILNFLSINDLRINKTEHTIIDLRTPALFAISHVPDAINMPFELVFEKKQLKILKKTQTPIIVYSETESMSVLAALLLRASGLEKVYAFPGNFDLIETLFTEKSLTPAYYYYTEEKSKWDFNKHFGGTQPKQETKSDFSMPQQIEIKQQVKGGC